VATAIRIGAPASYRRGVRAIRETNGVVIAVTDQEILDAKAAIDAAGVGCEPASAASVAGVRQLRRDGVISPDAQVVAVLTGHLLKDPGIVERMHSGTGLITRPNAPVPVAATLAAIRQAIG
jgi:threonine synthase